MSKPIDRELAKHTKLELATMLACLTDGHSADDIRGMTGMSMSLCKKIIKAGRGITRALWN